MRKTACWLLLAVVVVACGFQALGAEDKTASAGSPASPFTNFPGLPTCMKGSVQNGDPSKGGSVILAKAATGCTVPWHRHTATEQLMVVSGQAKVKMKDGAPASLRSGSYLSLPGSHVHQFTCLAACTFFIVSDAAFDIHYVDAAGKEISSEDALKTKADSKMRMKK